MLSGLTSQLGNLSGLIGSKQAKESAGNGGDTSNGASDTVALVTSDDSTGSAADQPQQTGVLNSVRNHIPSWLGGSKLTGSKDEVKEEVVVSVPPPNTGEISPDKESDASSATGGADSDNQISENEAAEKGMGLEKVKNLGNFLFSTIKGAGQKIKDTNILSEFQKEHDSFLRSKSGKSEAVAPWVGHSKEEALKEEILSLSNDRRNFVRSPPSGVSFTWDWEEMAPVAKAILKEDPNLEAMRYELVPKTITEEHFWRNYFYRVSLLKESMEDEPKSRPGGTIASDADLERELNEELRTFEVVGGNPVSAIDEKEFDALLDLK